MSYQIIDGVGSNSNRTGYNIMSNNLPTWHSLYNATPTEVDLDDLFVQEDTTFSGLTYLTYTNFLEATTAKKYLAQTGYFNSTFDPIEIDEYRYKANDVFKNLKGQLCGGVLSFARNLSTLNEAFDAVTPTWGTTTITRTNSTLTLEVNAASSDFVGPVQGQTYTYSKTDFNDNAIPLFMIIELVGGGGGGGCGSSPALQFHRGGSGGGGGGYLAFVADWRSINNKQIKSIVISSGSGGSGGSSNGASGSAGGATEAIIYYTDGTHITCSANGGEGGGVTSDIDFAPVASGGGVSGAANLISTNNLYLLSSATGGDGGKGATKHRVDFNGFNSSPTSGDSVSAHDIKLVPNTTNNLLCRSHSAKSGGSHGTADSSNVPGGGGGASMISAGAPGGHLDGPYALDILVANMDGVNGAGGGGSGALASDSPRGGKGGSGGFYLWY